MCARTDEPDILDLATELITVHSTSPRQRRLLDAVLDDQRRKLAATGVGANDLLSVRLPLLVYAAVTGTEAPARPLAAALTLLYCGIDLLDDVMDGDLGAHWAGHRPGEVLLGAFTLIAALPQLVIGSLPASPAVIASMQRTLAAVGMAMSAGQQLDLLLAGERDPAAATVAESVAGKSGAFAALAAALAAQFAGAPAAAVAGYAALGRALAIVRQLRSDCHEAFVAPHSRDLARGARTLPIALCLERLAGDEREVFLSLLDEAGTSTAALMDLRRILTAHAIPLRCAAIIESYVEDARTALAGIAAHGPARAALLHLIRRSSLLTSATARA